jgi:hypothetical protein
VNEPHRAPQRMQIPVVHPVPRHAQSSGPSHEESGNSKRCEHVTRRGVARANSVPTSWRQRCARPGPQKNQVKCNMRFRGENTVLRAMTDGAERWRPIGRRDASAGGCWHSIRCFCKSEQGYRRSGERDMLQKQNAMLEPSARISGSSCRKEP